MQNAPRNEDNREYLIVSVMYSLREGGYATGAAPGEYGFHFGVQPTSFHSGRRASRARPAPTARRLPPSSGLLAKTSGSTSTAA
jgi:type VI secretion system secreted protein VgrG